MDTNTKYYIIGGAGLAILLYIIAKGKGQSIRQMIVQDTNDILYGMSGGTDTIITSDGAFNNVGNIRVNPNVTYQGEISSPSKNFKSFENVSYGYRAMIELLRAYYLNDQCTTLRQMINRYAPSGDGSNDPNAYMTYVSNQTGVGLDDDMQSVLYSPTITAVIVAMSNIEQGNNFTSQAGITDGANKGYYLA